MSVRILTGDCRTMLADLEPESVQCCVTSPPYHGLRAYGGDPGMIGLEPTIDEHIAALVDVFRGVWRVLRDDGTVWLNYGDAYAGSAVRTNSGFNERSGNAAGARKQEQGRPTAVKSADGLKPKDLIGLPWRIAFALQADGWCLRSAIIWHKPNPMPESVTDRPTSAYEHIFLLSKSGKYFYDADAIRETALSADRPQPSPGMKQISPNGNTPWMDNRYAPGASGYGVDPAGRNARNVWTIATAGFSEAHFAVFPPEIPRRCILAGTSDKGECPACGAPWVRMTEEVKPEPVYVTGKNVNNGNRNDKGRTMFVGGSVTTTGWQPSCTCDADPVPQVVLDPFAGAGTTLLVADRLGRNGVGIEVNPEYVAMAQRRITNDAPLFVELETA